MKKPRLGDQMTGGQTTGGTRRKAPTFTFNTNDPGPFKRAVDMTDDELAAIVAKAKLTVVK